MSVAMRASPENVLDNLYPTLLECFGIIFIGYMTGRCNIVTPSQGRGIGKFVTSIALPAVIFNSLTKLEFGLVDWRFWSAICLAKALLFLLVSSVTLLFGKSVGKAGIYGIFVTQSNDLAVGLPLFDAIYGRSHPELIQYIYLLIPVSIAIINPIGFSLLEYEKAKSAEDGKESTGLLGIVWKAFCGFIRNPLVFMVVLGLLGNVVFKQKVPSVLEQFLNVLSQSFSATALFALGLSMVGKMKKYTGFSLVVPIVLIMMKSLFLPLLMRETVYVFSSTVTNETDVTSSFAFLYGALPTAPPVVLYAVSYNCEVDTIASGMVLGTVLALPIMVVSSIMMSVSTHQATMNFMEVISAMSFDVCFVGIVCCIWVLGVFILVKVALKVPQRYMFCIVLCQVMMSVSIALSRIHFDQHYSAMGIAALFSIGLFGSHGWVAILAYTLHLLRCRGEARANKNGKLIMILGWSAPVLIAAILVPLLPAECLHLSSHIMLFDFRLHKSFNMASIVVLILTTLVTVVSLALLKRGDKYCRCKNKPQLDAAAEPLLVNESAVEKCSRCKFLGDNTSRQQMPGLNYSSSEWNSCLSDTDNLQCCADNGNGVPPSDIENIASSRCLLERMRGRQKYNALDDAGVTPSLINAEHITVEEYYQGERHQLSRHVIFILIMTLIAVINLFLCLWRLLGDPRSGIYLELEFLLALFTFGQGFLSFVVFGFHKQLFTIPESLGKLFSSCKRKSVTAPPPNELTPEVVRLCQGFTVHHVTRCQQELVKNIRCRLRMYHNTFRGTELVDWLIDNGLAISRHAAVKYGNRLLRGRVIEHITEQHLFYDLPYFYRFHTRVESLDEEEDHVSGKARSVSTN